MRFVLDGRRPSLVNGTTTADLALQAVDVAVAAGLIDDSGRVLVVPALAFALPRHAGLTTAPDFLRSLVDAIRLRRPGARIAVALPGHAAWSGEEALEWSGLGDVVRACGLELADASVHAMGLRITLATLATHPDERVAGVLWQHAAHDPSPSSATPADRRRQALAFAARVSPGLCVVDARRAVDWQSPNMIECHRGPGVVVGTDPVLVDTACALLLGLSPRIVPVLRLAGGDAHLGSEAAGFPPLLPGGERPVRYHYDERTRAFLSIVPLSESVRGRLAAKWIGSAPTAFLMRAIWRRLERAGIGVGLS